MRDSNPTGQTLDFWNVLFLIQYKNMKFSAEVFKSKEKKLTLEEKMHLKKETDPQAILKRIQGELMNRSSLGHNLWVERHAVAFRELFENSQNQKLFMDLYQEVPEELYALLEKALDSRN